ncbi:hypothetical protein RND81_02G109600 [Saponaria officinalis]|uniref:Uncharacterized protein n=1 Tax=Saponaria officinalis TaxID=3572 RepID=A0AAW1MUP2_SAPOF
MSHAYALAILVKSGHLTLLGPTTDPSTDKRSPRWDASAYCNYHRGNGHSTEDFFKLKNVIQDLFDAGKVPKLSGPPPSNKANPLGNHAIFVGSIPIIDCSHLISSSEPEINGIWFSDEEDEWPPAAEVNRVEYKAVPRDYGKKKRKKSKGKGKAHNEVSYLTRARKAQRNPWVSDDSAEAPQDKEKGITVLDATTTITPPLKTDTATPSTAAETPPTPAKGTEDVLQKQFLKTKADITVPQLLRDSEEQRTIFFNALKKVVTNSESSPNQVVNHISTEWLPGAITFSDSDLPAFGPQNNLALYINVECQRKSLPVTLVDEDPR